MLLDSHLVGTASDLEVARLFFVDCFLAQLGERLFFFAFGNVCLDTRTLLFAGSLVVTHGFEGGVLLWLVFKVACAQR